MAGVIVGDGGVLFGDEREEMSNGQRKVDWARESRCSALDAGFPHHVRDKLVRHDKTKESSY